MPRLTAARRVVAVVLAAGASTRFGGDKLLRPLNGRPLAEYIAATLSDLPLAARLAARLAVCPAGNAARRDVFTRHGYAIIDNPHPEHGMGSSLALGAQHAMALDAEALLVCLADMPFVPRDHLTALLSIDALAVATECNGTRSPPAVFARELFPQLAVLTGDQGARALIKSAATVTAAPDLVRDFDTPADFA